MLHYYYGSEVPGKHVNLFLNSLQLEFITDLDLNLSLLTALYLNSSDLGKITISILRRRHNVERLVIGASTPFANANLPEPEAEIVLPRLRVLMISGDILEYLVAPTLEELHNPTTSSAPIDDRLLAYKAYGCCHGPWCLTASPLNFNQADCHWSKN